MNSGKILRELHELVKVICRTIQEYFQLLRPYPLRTLWNTITCSQRRRAISAKIKEIYKEEKVNFRQGIIYFIICFALIAILFGPAIEWLGYCIVNISHSLPLQYSNIITGINLSFLPIFYVSLRMTIAWIKGLLILYIKNLDIFKTYCSLLAISIGDFFLIHCICDYPQHLTNVVLKLYPPSDRNYAGSSGAQIALYLGGVLGEITLFLLPIIIVIGKLKLLLPYVEHKPNESILNLKKDKSSSSMSPAKKKKGSHSRGGKGTVNRRQKRSRNRRKKKSRK